MKKRDIYLAIIFFVLAIFFAFILPHILSTKPLSDAAYYSLVTEKVINTGEIPKTIEKIPSGGNYYPINYPAIFFINNSLNLIILGSLTMLKLICFFLFSIYMFFIFNRALRLKISLSVAATMTISFMYGILYYFFVHQKQEFIFVTFLIIATYYLLDKKNYSSILCILSLIFLIGIKQISYIPAFFIFIFIFIFSRVSWKKKLVVVLIIFVLILPILSEMFVRTGTITFTNSNMGIISKGESLSRNLLGISLAEMDPEWDSLYSGTQVQSNRDQNKMINFRKVILGFIPKNIAWFSLIFISSLGIFFVLKKNIWALPIVFIIITSIYLYLEVTKIYQYFVFVPPLVLMFLFFMINKQYIAAPRIIRFFILFFIIILIFSTFSADFIGLINAKQKNDGQIKLYETSLPDAGNIISSRTYELALYQDREIYWFNSYGNFELYHILKDYNESKLNKYMIDNNITYIFIPITATTKLEFGLAWPGSMPLSLLNRFDNDSKLIKTINDPWLKVYQLKNETTQ